MNKTYAFVVLVGEQNPKLKYLKKYLGPNTHEVLLSGIDGARKHGPGLAVSIAGYMHEAVRAGRTVPQLWLTAQAQYEDGSPVNGSPAIPYVAPPATKKAAIPELPEIPPVMKLSDDDSWRVVPRMDIKYSQHGSYYAVPYAFLFKGSPVSGYFEAPTRQDLLDVIFNTAKDAKPDGSGGWLDPYDPQIIGTPTIEQIYRSLLPVADAAMVESHLAAIATREAAITKAEYELVREPTETEIQAVDVSDAVIDKMPAAVLKDRVLSDKAFAAAYDRRERAFAAFAVKAQKERQTENEAQAAKDARERLANREKGVFSER